MKKISVFFLILAFSLMILSSSFHPADALQPAEDVEVQVSIYPIFELADRIAGDRLEIEQVTPQGTEIHGYEPSPRRMAALERADAFILVGAGLEPWGDRAIDTLDGEDIKILELAGKVDLRLFEEEHDHDHNHEHGHENDEQKHDKHEHDIENEEGHDHEHDHQHGEYDTHIWLDFEIMQRAAAELSDLFAELDPEGKEMYREKKEAVQEKLAELDNAYREGLAERIYDDIIVSHAAFGYLADNYALNQHAVTGLSPHDEPSPRAVRRLIDLAEETGVEHIFMEVLASPETVEVIASEADLEILTLNPAAGLTEEDIKEGRDYFDIMYQNLENLQKALNP